MSPRGGARLRTMSATDIRTRAATARKYLEIGELVHDEEPDEAPSRQVAGGLAVLAAIAASDAICGSRTGSAPQGQDHAQAVSVLEATQPDGRALATHLRRVLDHKANAHYGTTYLTDDTVTSMLRHARSLVDALESTI
ncbi:hypothetical protein ASD16_09455 [Cellulomonas sp. Root485]|nr:hypothetical protein ASD16_09455 [Cellulomonas sp. Root485]